MHSLSFTIYDIKALVIKKKKKMVKYFTLDPN